MSTRRQLTCGLMISHVPEMATSLSSICNLGYHFICAPLVHPRYRQEFTEGKALKRVEAFTRSDLVLNSQDWNTLVVGKISPWIDLDSPHQTIRKQSEKVLEQELNYGTHLGLPALLLPLNSFNCANLARYVYGRLLSSGHLSPIWISVPLQAPRKFAQSFIDSSPSEDLTDDDVDDPSNLDTWEWWSKFHRLCDTDKRLNVALELTADLPPFYVLKRWLGEQIQAVILPTHIFVTNKKGYPVLPKAHQAFVQDLYKLEVQVIIKGADRHGNLKFYEQYMEHLWNTQPPEDSLTKFARGFEDYLQMPLQPLMDNLESSTYEIFEKDPIKYTKYQEAIYQALLDRVPEECRSEQVITLMVVGAGRGPLVRAALMAAHLANVRISVYAVEKNPNAIVTLIAQKRDVWGDKVTVVATDMREWQPPEKADILVSELLGSFGDNELSPECLDGAQKFLKDDGISIPSSYTSYMSPVQSPKLYGNTTAIREKDKHPLHAFEMPYVVRLHNHMEIADPQPLFTFHHPNKSSIIDNSRFKSLQFRSPFKCTMHGFAGYFDTVLYKDIVLSIVPSTHSPGMFSWFPIFFPLKDPVGLEKGSLIEVNIWRCCTKKNVWYEWNITSPIITPTHNPNGRSYTIGL